MENIAGTFFNEDMEFSLKAEYSSDDSLRNFDESSLKNDWTKEEIRALFSKPFMDLVFEAQEVHRKYNKSNEVQLSTLVNIKSGGCSEDCKYCSQSSRYNTDVEKTKLLDLDTVLTMAKKAKEAGASRICMGAAWRSPSNKSIELLGEIITKVKSLGMQTCMTLGILNKEQAKLLADKGLDYYNHNIDTSEEYYKEIITTRTYQDRLDTIQNVRDVGINVCSGGIIGMGESREDRVGMLYTLSTMPRHPESVPINKLVKMEGTPFADKEDLSVFEWIKTIAVARILMPKSYVRLSAGRSDISKEAQALCFLAGANSIFYGDRLLTSPNPNENEDLALFKELGIEAI